MELTSSSHRTKEKDAIRRLSFIKYAAGGGSAADVYSSGSSGGGSDGSSVDDDPLIHPVIHQHQSKQQHHHQLTELELLRVETFFRGNQTQIFVGKSLANL
jgi:hypothetical protein